MKKKKKVRKPYNSITYLTGWPELNIKKFNSNLENPETIIPQPENQPNLDQVINLANDGAGSSEANDNNSTSADTGNSMNTGGELGENMKITEAKRNVKRYYIRPWNVFCSNKTEVLKELIKNNDKNCSIYTLKNLEDNTDIHKLTNHDIIYYYDNGILYDKNKIKVMDYDLLIKHEEDRKKINPETTSEKIFSDVYADRLTGADLKMEENLEIDNPFDLTFDPVNAYGELILEAAKHEVCSICGEAIVGYGNNAEPYASGRCCDSCNIKFVIPKRLELFNQSRIKTPEKKVIEASNNFKETTGSVLCDKTEVEAVKKILSTYYKNIIETPEEDEAILIKFYK